MSIDVRNKTKKSLRAQIGIVEQDVFLFAGTIRNADRIVVVTKDGIAEQGRHDELLARGEVFAKLHQVQYQQ